MRTVWQCVWLVLFRPTPRLMHGWRSMLLRAFGAQVGRGAHPYPSCRIWAPWNLVMGDHACLGPYADCYNVARIVLGEHARVSQHAHLCSATHDYTKLTMPLVTKPIRIGAWAWVAADAFVGPGITVEEGAVVGARACVVHDVSAWTVVAGNPARVIKRRLPEGAALDSNRAKPLKVSSTIGPV